MVDGRVRSDGHRACPQSDVERASGALSGPTLAVVPSRFLTLAEVAAELGLDEPAALLLVRRNPTPGTYRLAGPRWVVDRAYLQVLRDAQADQREASS